MRAARPFRLSTARLGLLILAAWALLAQSFATGVMAAPGAVPGSGLVICSTSAEHGGSDPASPGLPGACACPMICASAVALPGAAPVTPVRAAPGLVATLRPASFLGLAAPFRRQVRVRGPPPVLA